MGTCGAGGGEGTGDLAGPASFWVSTVRKKKRSKQLEAASLKHRRYEMLSWRGGGMLES